MPTKIHIVTDVEGVSGIGRESQAYAAKGHVDYADNIAWKSGVECLDARRVRWSVDSASRIYWVP